MADVDSSLLYFCSQVAKEYKVALTGECADEIFGGYPWFHKKRMSGSAYVSVDDGFSAEKSNAFR